MLFSHDFCNLGRKIVCGARYGGTDCYGYLLNGNHKCHDERKRVNATQGPWMCGPCSNNTERKSAQEKH